MNTLFAPGHDAAPLDAPVDADQLIRQSLNGPGKQVDGLTQRLDAVGLRHEVMIRSGRGLRLRPGLHYLAEFDGPVRVSVLGNEIWRQDLEGRSHLLGQQSHRLHNMAMVTPPAWLIRAFRHALIVELKGLLELLVHLVEPVVPGPAFRIRHARTVRREVGA